MNRQRSHARRSVLVMLGALVAAGCAPTAPSSPAESYTVAYVLDGDTITVDGPDGEQRVRLLGINTPEISHDDAPGECGGEEATNQLEELLPEGTPIVLRGDARADDVDRYDRLLRYVELDDGTDTGRELIIDGRAYAWAPSSEPDPERLVDYEDATAAARESLTGSWATCDTMNATP